MTSVKYYRKRSASWNITETCNVTSNSHSVTFSIVLAINSVSPLVRRLLVLPCLSACCSGRRPSSPLLGRWLHQVVERGEDTEVSKCRVLKQESPLLTPWVGYIYKWGGRWQFAPGPLENTRFTYKPLGRHMRPIYKHELGHSPNSSPSATLVWLFGKA